MTVVTDGESPGSGRFPDGFVWGVATSSYQIEGAVAEDGRGLSIWDVFAHTPGATRRGDTGDVACDSYHRMEEDLRLLEELGVGSYRFSIAWPRVQPDGRGAVNLRGLDYYRRLVDGLRERGIAPAATLYHWELPQALEDRGGWGQRETAERFAEYAAAVAAELGDAVAMWITVNEPRQTVHQGYRVGTHAPGRRNPALAAAATHHILLAHGLAMAALRTVLAPGTPVGVSIDLDPVRALDSEAREAARRLDAELNRIYLDPVLHGAYPADARPEMLPPEELIAPTDMEIIGARLDFLGINYYRPQFLRAGDVHDLRAGERPVPGLPPGIVGYLPPERPHTIMDWTVEPEGLYDVLLRLRDEAPGLAVYVTENGCAADDYVDPDGAVNDEERVSFLHGHLDAALRAIGDGANLAGYFHWCLMDNFEWAYGYGRRFGLYYVDFATQTRLPKRSAAFYAAVIRAGGLPAPERDGDGRVADGQARDGRVADARPGDGRVADGQARDERVADARPGDGRVAEITGTMVAPGVDPPPPALVSPER